MVTGKMVQPRLLFSSSLTNSLLFSLLGLLNLPKKLNTQKSNKKLNTPEVWKVQDDLLNLIIPFLYMSYLQFEECEQHWGHGFWGWEHSRKSQSRKPSAREWWCSPLRSISLILYFVFQNFLFGICNVVFCRIWKNSPLCLADGSLWYGNLWAPVVEIFTSISLSANLI